MPVPLLRIRPPRLGGQRNPIDPYLPGQQEVDEELRRQEEQRPNFFFRLLEIPGRLLGGQSIQGFLEGYAEGGVGEGARKAFVNNPLFQLFQITGIGDETLGDALEAVGLKEQGSAGLTEDTNFSKVRDAFGWDVGDNILVNIGVDLVGELITSPVEFLISPFGLTSKGLKAATAARKAGVAATGLGADVGMVAKMAGSTPFRTIEQITPDVAKATEQGLRTMFAFKVPFTEAGFSVPIPKTLDLAAARTLRNTADFLNTSPVTKPFMKMFNRNYTALGKVSEGLDGAEYAGKALTGPERRFLAKEVLKGHDQAKAQFMSVYMTKLANVLETTPDVVKADPTYNKLVAMMIEGDIEEVDNFNDIFSRIQQGWKERHELAGDSIDRAVGQAHGYGRQGMEVDVAFDTVTPEAIAREKIASAQMAGETPGTVQTISKFRDDTVPALFSVITEAKNPEELFGQLKDYAIKLKELGEELGDAERMNRLLDDAFTPYVPRDVTPEVRNALDIQFSKYYEGRKFSEMTVLEANAVMLELGTKLTDFKSVKQIMAEGGDDFFGKMVAKIFDKDFMKGLRKNHGAAADGVVDFFNTNQADVWYKRIEKAAERKAVKEFWSSAFAPGSKLVLEERTLQNILDNPALIEEMQNRGLKPVVVSQKGIYYEPEKTTYGEMLKDALHLNDRGKIKSQKRSVENVITAQVKAQKVTIQEAVDELDAIADVNVRYRKTAKPGYSKKLMSDLSPATPEGEARIKRYLQMEQDLEAIQRGPMADTPITKNLEKQIDMLRTWDDVPLAKLDPDERDLINGQIDAKQEMAEAISEQQAKIERHKESIRMSREQRKNATPQQKAAIDYDIRVATARRDEAINELANMKKEALDTKGRAKKLLEKGRKRRDAEFQALREHEAVIRQSVAEARDSLNSGFREFRDAVQGHAKQTKKALTKVGKQFSADSEESTKHLWDRYLAWREASEKGVDGLQELQRIDPDAYAAMTKRAKDTNIAFVDEEMYNEFLDPENGILARINKPDSGWLRNIFSFFHLDEATAAWKAATLNPAFMATRSRDWASTAFMFVQGGVRPHKLPQNSWIQAGFLRGVDDFLKTGKTEALDAHYARLPQNIRDALAKEGVEDGKTMFQALQRLGVITKNLIEERFVVQTGEAALNLNRGKSWGQMAKDIDFGELATKLSAQRVPIFKKMHRGGENFESGMRISAFMDWIDQGLSTSEAAHNVMKWGYDPRRMELSHAERTVLRRFIPFYGFARKAVEMQVNAFFTSPGKVTWFQKAQEAAWNLHGLSPAEQEAALPEFVRDGFGIPIDKDEKGRFRVKLFGTLFPMAQVGDLANALAATLDDDSSDGIRNYLGKQMNPFIKLPIEQALNHSFFTQRPIERFEGQTVEYLGMTMSPKTKHTLMSIRFLNEIDNLGILTSEQAKAAMLLKKDQPKNMLQKVLESAFMPTQPFAKSYTVDVQKNVEWESRKVGQEISKARSEMRRAIEDPNKELSDENLSALKKLMAKKMAELELMSRTAQRYQQ